MQQLVGYSGEGNFFPGASIYPNRKESNAFLSRDRHVDVFFPSKRSRISAPIVFSEENFEEKQPVSIEVLPDECLFEVFRRLPGGEERSTCACVSKRWLMLLSSICNDEICSKKATQSLKTGAKTNSSEKDEPLASVKSDDGVGSNGDTVEGEGEDQEIENCGYLSRCLEGKKATDVGLAAMAVGTGSCGGLGKLSVRGTSSSCGLTDLGLRAIARCCPSLRVLSLWNVSSIGDEGLCEIAKGCRLLEKLDLCHCPGISDKALLAIAKNCPNLTTLTIESCSKIGNGSLQAVGSCCRNLKTISIKNCPLVGDQGIAGLLSSAGPWLTNLKLQVLNISDMSLAVIGHYGKAITDLVFNGLQNVTERGFWVMGNAQGLQKLRSLTVSSCGGVTDLGLEAVGKCCPNLKQVCLRRCAFLSDNGLASFSRAAMSLESLQLEECHRITQSGFFGVLLNCVGKLKTLSLANCLGFKDFACGFPPMSSCTSLRSLSICNCPGFGNVSMAMLGRLCPQLERIQLNELHGISDEGLLPLLEGNEAGLLKVNLSGCINLTDKVVSVIAKLHGLTLEQLNLDGCKYITDASLVAIANSCFFLSELDISKCAITDSGIAALACAVQLNLQILSVSGCSYISKKSLPALVSLGRTLVGLNIQRCAAISSSMVDVLVERLWRCDILS